MLSSLLLISAALAVQEPAALHGQVVDPSGSSVPNAVVILGVEGRTPRSVSTDRTGAFELALAPGAYRLRITAPGFEDLRALLSLVEGRNLAEYVLKVRPVAESVEVRAQGDYQTEATASGTRTLTPLRDVPQSITVTRKELIRDQMMLGLGDVMRYTPGVQVHQGENNRDQVIIRGNSSSADFFVNGVRDDVQYYRDLYNLDRVEVLKGPNAMMFGRGGGGGVVNRVTKEAEFSPTSEVVLQGGARQHKRVSGDFGRPFTDAVAVRVNGMYEDSGSFRRGVNLERYGINPTLTFAPSHSTRLTLGFEHLHDRRVADRGITSFQGAPVNVPISTYYGNPQDSRVRADVDLATLSAEHTAGRLTFRNRLLLGRYDRFYQNYVPGAVAADQSTVALTAYNNATRRQNVFDQIDIIYAVSRGRVKHTLLGGVEFGHQATDNFRNTGFFNDTTTNVSVPHASSTISTPVTFRQSATDASNRVTTALGAAYVQDQVELSPKLQVVAGLRFDRFDLTYFNKRNNSTLSRLDDLISPRAGVVIKPAPSLSIYASHTVSYLPSSGDQFSSLSTITQQVKPEKFLSYEIGTKWDPRPGLALTWALYRLDRTNTRATDPNDVTRIVQTGSQRTIGLEIGVAGRLTSAWRIAGGYAYQDAFVSSATAAAPLGARVAQVPNHTFSLWNHYQFMAQVGLAIGVMSRDDMFATIDNRVRLPGYTRVDLAAFYSITKDLRLQANLENVFDRRYWINADSNTNISPGQGRALRAALTARF